MRRFLLCFSLALGVLLTTHVARADEFSDDSFSFSLEPVSGDVSGPAGSTVGWGYSITNNSASDELILIGVDSSVFPADDGTPDASIFDFPVITAGDTDTEDYDPIAYTGLFQFTWNADPTDTSVSGTFDVYGIFCDSDGNCSDTVSESAAYTATLIPSSGPPVSEPSSLPLLLLGIGVIALAFRLRRQPSGTC